MNDPIMETLVKRMKRLERENDRLKRIASLMLVGIGALVMMGQAQCNLGNMVGSKPTQVVEAQEFIVRDASGRPRAKLTESGLTLTDSNGNERIMLGVESGGSVNRMEFRDEDGSRRFFLASYKNHEGLISRGNVELHLFGISGIICLSTGTWRPNEARGTRPYLSVSDKDHKTTTELTPAHL